MNLDSCAFPNGGIYVLRHGDLYMAVDCGRNGLNDWGGHGHNDTLSFELAVGNTTFVADPGAYTYTASREWHDRFRSTAYHNVVRVDSQEMNRFIPHDFWGLRNDAIPTVASWLPSQEADLLDARHSGYLRLPSPVNVRRQIYFQKTEHPRWLIRDYLDGVGEHLFELYFHIGQAVIERQTDDSTILLQSTVDARERLQLAWWTSEIFALTVEETWSAPCYGVKHPSQAVRLSMTGTAPVEFITILWPCRAGSLPVSSDTLSHQIQVGRQELNFHETQ